MSRFFGNPSANIGYPKLFIGGEESAAPLSPQPTVNNFVQMRDLTIQESQKGIISGYDCARFSRLGGLGLSSASRPNDYELYRPARRAGLDLLTTTQRPSPIEGLFYIDVARSSPRANLLTINPQLIICCP